MADPLFILAPHRSFTSVVCTMLGQHPQMYGLPEVNLFVAERMGEWWTIFHRGRALGAHGLLRAVAELYFEEQTERTIELARRWIWRRIGRATASVFHELAERAAPLILVDKSPNTASRPEFLNRAYRAFPAAKFLHLLRHPQGHGKSNIVALREFGVELGPFNGRSSDQIDPQEWWYRYHRNIRDFLAPLPDEQKMRLRGEDLMSDPDYYLPQIAKWLGLRTDAAAIEEMKHPERSPFACIGPRNASLGNDLNLLKEPQLRPYRAHPQSLEEPPNWRKDGRAFSPKVKQLAREFGYQ